MGHTFQINSSQVEALNEITLVQMILRPGRIGPSKLGIGKSSRAVHPNSPPALKQHGMSIERFHSVEPNETHSLR